MRALKTAFLAAAVASAAAVSPAQAQTGQLVSLQFSGLGAVLFGSEFENIDAGFGGEAQIRFTPSAFSIGAGFQFTTHGTPLTAGDGLALEEGGFLIFTEDPSFRLYGAFLEPRIVIPVRSDYVAPYLSVRLSLLTERIPSFDVELFDDLGNLIDEGQIGFSATGLTINGGGGLLFALGRRVNLDVGATVGWTDFNEATVTVDGEEGSFPSRAGGNVVFRVGFAIGLGS
jgi:hypothetical protein